MRTVALSSPTLTIDVDAWNTTVTLSGGRLVHHPDAPHHLIGWVFADHTGLVVHHTPRARIMPYPFIILHSQGLKHTAAVFAQAYARLPKRAPRLAQRADDVDTGAFVSRWIPVGCHSDLDTLCTDTLVAMLRDLSAGMVTPYFQSLGIPSLRFRTILFSAIAAPSGAMTPPKLAFTTTPSLYELHHTAAHDTLKGWGLSIGARLFDGGLPTIQASHLIGQEVQAGHSQYGGGSAAPIVLSHHTTPSLDTPTAHQRMRAVALCTQLGVPPLPTNP